MPISKPHSSLGGNNSGSCTTLAQYLDKENQDLEKIIKLSDSISTIALYEKRKQHFFDASSDKVSLISVIDKIDNNRKKLTKKDAKFFAPTISFSPKELDHISQLATGKKVTSVWDFTNDEYLKYNNLLRAYGRKVMDEYAANFNRQHKGLNEGKDLVYFSKIEHFRKFKGNDKKVKEGLFSSGDFKPGLQTHIHYIVSRKDKSQKMKLSPLANERSEDRILGKNKYRVGFDRSKWINSNEKMFDKFFKYQRQEIEKFEVQKISKHGSPQEKDILNQKIERENKINRRNTNRDYNSTNNRGLSR